MTAFSEPAKALQAYTTPLTTTDPDSETTDIQPLLDQFENKRIVAMGEATHGTREFFQLKHRLIRLLITELEFRAIGLEADFAETRAINDYIVSGEGTPERALADTRFWTWHTEELRALLKWLREFNEGRDPSDRVRLFGFDAQFGQGAASAVAEFLETVDEASLSDLSLDTLRSGALRDRQSLDDQLITKANGIVDDLQEQFESNRAEYIEQTSQDAWTVTRQHVRTLRQAVDLATTLYETGDLHAATTVRDRAMASNVEWVLSYTDAEHIALWGHNEHVLKGASNYGDEAYHPMGHHLTETFGDEYYALGFAFSQGSFQALYREDNTSQPSLQECTVGPVHEEWPPQALHPETESWLPVNPVEPALSAVLATSEDDIEFVDVETAASDPALQPWLSDPHLLYSIGAVFVRGPRTVTPYCVPEEMDGLLCVTETSRAVPLNGA